jgi:hypothetical protein
MRELGSHDRFQRWTTVGDRLRAEETWGHRTRQGGPPRSQLRLGYGYSGQVLW